MSTSPTRPLPTTDEIEFFFDPLCPWAWITSRLVVEVSRHRTLDITWRLISLAVLNEDPDDETTSPARSAFTKVGHENMRILASVSKNQTNADLGSLYTALGDRLHTSGRSSEIFGEQRVEGAHLQIMREALDEVGLDADFIDSATDESLDELVRMSTEEALARTGRDVGTPVITYDTEHPDTSSYFGPVLNRIPRGTEAVEVFEAVSGLALVGGFAELKRSDRGDIDFR